MSSPISLQEAELLSRTWVIALTILFLMIGLSVGMPGNRVIPASEIEAKIKTVGPIEFDNCTIVGDLNLSRLRIERPVHFNRTTFQDSVNFNSTIFNGDAYFWSSAFNGTVDFKDTVFNDSAEFEESKFNGYVEFWDSVFNNYADFGSSTFKDDAHFYGAVFNDGAGFMFSNFNGIARFEYSKFNGYAEFWGARFNGTVDLEHVTFDREANFNNVIFKRDVSFSSSQFNDDIFFKNTTIQGELSLTDTTYNKLFIRWYNIKGGLVYDDTAYMSLLKNFKDLGYLEDYDSCYVQYRKDHRKQPWPAVSGWEAFIRKTIDYPLEWFYGYGKKPFNAFFISLGIVIAFAFYWWAVGLGGPRDKTKERLKDGEEWLDGDVTDILGFSVTVFLSGTKFFIDPPALPNIEGRSRSWIKKAFILERVLGALFSVLFFVAIGGTIVRTA